MSRTDHPDADEQAGLTDEQKIRLQGEIERANLKEEARLRRRQSQRDAEVAAIAAERAAKYALEKAKWDNEYELNAAYHFAILEQASAGFIRARQGSEFVEKAAAAIGAIYASLLGFVFVADSNPLPARGAIPAIFLGLAIAFAAAYLAFLKKAESVPGREVGSNLRVTQENRSFFFDRWVRAGVMSKRYAARAAVIALAVAVMFLPAPFVGVSVADTTLALPTQAPIPDKDIDDPELRRQRFIVDLEIYRVHALASIEQSSRDPVQVDAEDGDTGSDAFWWLAAVIALAAVLIGPWAYERREVGNVD